MRLLLVEDEPSLASILQYDLSKQGYVIDHVLDGLDAWAQFNQHEYDIALLDWMLPRLSGLELMKRIKQISTKTIVIMVTAKGDELDAVEALELGADDYVVKPCSSRELIARIEAFLRRRQKLPIEDILTIGELTLNQTTRHVTVNNHDVDLTKKAFDLLAFLMLNQDVIVSREQILNAVWGFDFDGTTRIVDVFVLKLRDHLKETKVVIETIRGYGYCLRLTKS